MRHRLRVPFRRAGSCTIWRLGFRQFSFHHIARVPRRTVPDTWTRPPVSCHALVPLTFRRQVRHQTQGNPSNPSRLRRGYDEAPRGALLFCRDPRFGLSQITWRTSVAHHPTEDSQSASRPVRTSCTGSRRPPGAARAADTAGAAGLPLTLPPGCASTPVSWRESNNSGPPWVTRSFYVQAGLLPVRHSPRRPEPVKSAYGVLRIGCADS